MPIIGTPKFDLQHEPDPKDRATWRRLVDVVNRIEGFVTETAVSSGGNASKNNVVEHKLGRVPTEVWIAVIPGDGISPFAAWEVPSLRTKRHVVVRSDSTNVADRIRVKVR